MTDSRVYTALKTAWRTLPASFRSKPIAVTLREWVGSHFSSHKQAIYTRAYYLRDVEDEAKSSSTHIVESICAKWNPKRVVDVGCGSGALLQCFAGRDIVVQGLEYSDAGCQMTRERGVSVEPFDVRFDDANPAWAAFDVVCCTEVAEHIPEQFAGKLVDTLTRLGRNIVFTAATPGQGGTDHVNEQPHSYWIEKFADHQYEFCEELTKRWAADWRKNNVAQWYWTNLLVFRRCDN